MSHDYGLFIGGEERPAQSGVVITPATWGAAHRVASRLKAGNVWINSWGNVHSASPYGGYKMSGHGREMGFAIIDALTQEKSVWVSMR